MAILLLINLFKRTFNKESECDMRHYRKGWMTRHHLRILGLNTETKLKTYANDSCIHDPHCG